MSWQDRDYDVPNAWERFLARHSGKVLAASLVAFALALALMPGGW